MINIALCDDNCQYLCLFRDVLEKACRNNLPQGEDYYIGPAFDCGKSVLEYIKDHTVDVLFLDIDMPEMSGFEVARILCMEYPKTLLVFMSAYDNFVYSSFEYYPFAYLRKEHIVDELPHVIKRIADKKRESSCQITIVTKDGNKKVSVNAISFVESSRNYYTVHLVQGKEYTCRGTLTDFEKQVSGFDFFRIHSAYLINMEQVEQLPNNGFVLVDHVSLPVSQRRMQAFKSAYMDYTRRYFGT